jgi:fumarate reductase subunit D
MGLYDSHIEQLSDEGIKSLRRDDLGETNFGDIEPTLRSLRADLCAANEGSATVVPGNRLTTADQAVRNSLPNVLQQIADFDPMRQQGNPGQARLSLISTLDNIASTVAENLRPYVRPDFSAVNEMHRELAQMKSELSGALAEATGLLAQVKSTAVRVASERISGYYLISANSHKKVAFRYLVAAGILGVALVVAILLVFYVAPPVASVDGQSIDVATLIRESLGRVLALLVLVAATSFCTRNYRVNKHLEIVNRTRYNALETADLYVASVTSDDVRNIVVSELVRSIFTPGDTGYMNTDREQTIIENPGSLIGLLGTAGKK